MMWRASEKMTSILSSEYLLSGSTSASLWTLGDADFDKEVSTLDPGTLVLLFKSSDDHDYIIGGAYFLGWSKLSIKDAWDLFGVRNGVFTHDDLVNEVIARGGNKDSELSMAQLVHTFIFDANDYVHVPDEMREEISSRHVFTLPLTEPLGRYLHTRVLERRDSYISAEGGDWQGMYYAASHRNSKSYVAEFHARVLNAYGFRCALSGVQARPVLFVAHIQPFYDSKFQKASNGVVLRSDLYQLFKAGYITFVYDESREHLRAKVSNTVRTAFGEDYMRYDGQELLLPEDKSHWPEPKYVKWHNNMCYENWLHLGGSHG